MHSVSAWLRNVPLSIAMLAGASLWLASCSSESDHPRPVAWHKIPVPHEALVTIYARLARTAYGNATSPAEGPRLFFVELEGEAFRQLQDELAAEGFIVRDSGQFEVLPRDRAGNPVDPETGRRAARLSVGASWMGENRINAGAEYYVGPEWAAGYRISIARESGEWVFTRFERTWVS